VTTIITRLYASEDKALAAVSALKRRFGEDEINLVTPSSGKDAAALETAIAKGGVKPSAAAGYAEKVGQGNSLVTVQAGWGFANEAIATLDRAGPIGGDEGGDVTSDVVLTGWNEAAPFSAYLGWPVLIGGGDKTFKNWNEAAPFSKWLGWPLLSEFKSGLVLKDDPAPFSRWAKWPVLDDRKPSAELLNNPTPFSDRLGQPTISQEPPFSTLAKSDKSTTKLINWATPFSDFCNLPVLLKDKPPQS
jgi:hypothetical protein